MMELNRTIAPPCMFLVMPDESFLSPKLIVIELTTAAEYPKRMSPVVC